MSVIQSEFTREVTVGLNAKKNRILVTFDYDKVTVLKCKNVYGYRFIKDATDDHDGPHWLYPLDLLTSRALRDALGDDMVLTKDFANWAKEEVSRERNLSALATADDATLEVLPKVLPKLAKFLRPYQRADVKTMAIKNVINANQPGLGKTVETIAAIFEAGEEHYKGAHLVVAPKTSLDVVWEYELERWVGEPLEWPIIVTSGDDAPDLRRELIEMAQEFHDEEQPFFLVLNPAFITYRKDKSVGKEGMVNVNGKMEYPLVTDWPELFSIPWKTVVFDEYHKMGLTNTKTNTFKAVGDLEHEKLFMLSGTPMGGKPIKLWSALHMLEPQSFTSMWKWAGRWLEIEEVDAGRHGMKKKIKGLKREFEDQFYRELQPHMIRRLKSDVAKELPPKDFIDIWYNMTPRQLQQYEAMAAQAEIKIEEEHLSAVGILAEYTRLKQFANAHHKIESRTNAKGEKILTLKPTLESGMLPKLEALLDERGITGEEQEVQDSDEQVVIGSQSSTMVDMIHEWLLENGIAAAKITGDIKQKERTELTRAFQAGELRVLVMTTTAGGVAITLDKANTLIICDETWNPDDQEQLADRIHRISRIHQVTIYTLRAKASIEEYIQGVNLDKSDINQAILDARRKGFRATGKKAKKGGK